MLAFESRVTRRISTGNSKPSPRRAVSRNNWRPFSGTFSPPQSRVPFSGGLVRVRPRPCFLFVAALAAAIRSSARSYRPFRTSLRCRHCSNFTSSWRALSSSRFASSCHEREISSNIECARGHFVAAFAHSAAWAPNARSWFPPSYIPFENAPRILWRSMRIPSSTVSDL